MNRRDPDLERTRCESPVSKATPPGVERAIASVPSAVSNPDATVICSATPRVVSSRFAPVAMPKTGIAPVAHRPRATPRGPSVGCTPRLRVRPTRGDKLRQHLRAVPRDRWLLLGVAVVVLGFATQRTAQDVARRHVPSPSKLTMEQHASVSPTGTTATLVTPPRSATAPTTAQAATATHEPSEAAETILALESDAARAFLAGQLQQARDLYRQLANETGSDTFGSAARALERQTRRGKSEDVEP